VFANVPSDMAIEGVETFLLKLDRHHKAYEIEMQICCCKCKRYRFKTAGIAAIVDINQHGFMKNRSTITNLLEYASFVLNSIENSNQVDLIYTDFSKAFDCVRHQLLLNEMSAGIGPARCMWLRSYLSGRI
jgi:hypothetical protein